VTEIFVTNACSFAARRPSMQFRGQRVNFPRQLGVGFQLSLLLDEIVIRFRLLQLLSSILSHHHER
jgi:hypothetical protein